jgi:undecaprenyl-diphosphatase
MDFLHKRSTYIVLSAVSFILFTILSYFVWIGYEPLQNINQDFFQSIINSQVADYRTFWRFVTSFGGFVLLTVLTFFTAIYFFYKKDITDALIYAVGMSSGLALVGIIKQITSVDRPGYIYAVEQTFSFPSGHTALSVIFLLVTGYLYTIGKTNTHKKLVLALALILSILIAASRLALGEHWIIDIIGGYLLGLFIATSVILFFTRGPARGK